MAARDRLGNRQAKAGAGAGFGLTKPREDFGVVAFGHALSVICNRDAPVLIPPQRYGHTAQVCTAVQQGVVDQVAHGLLDHFRIHGQHRACVSALQAQLDPLARGQPFEIRYGSPQDQRQVARLECGTQSGPRPFQSH